MRQSADIVIVGAGVIGASIAWHLARRGCTSVLVLDRASAPGSGSTSKATGGFRAQFASEVNIRLSLLSRAKLLRFDDEVGADPGFRQCGYLWIASDEHAMRVLRDAQKLQHGLGLTEARMVDADQVREINPAVGRLDLAGGAFCESDGFIRPMNILQGYLDDATRRGAQIMLDEEVTGFRLGERRSVTAVVTRRGEIAAGVVVNAAGAWAGRVAAMAGVDLPVKPLRRSVAITVPTPALPEEMPMTIFTQDGFHLRVRDGRVLLLRPGASDEGVILNEDDTLDERWIDDVVQLAKERIPCLSNVQIDREKCWSGLYEMSPDHHAIAGTAVDVENFYLANGSSGHGVMHAPALGQILSEMILDGKASIDVEALRPSRFAEGKPNVAPTLI